MAIDFSNTDFEESFDSLVTTRATHEDDNEYSLRPKLLREYIGQEKAKGNLEVFIQAAKMRNEPLDHVLLHGPPGLGKTTLSNIIANEMGVNVRITSGPALEKAGDLEPDLRAALEIPVQSGEHRQAKIEAVKNIYDKLGIGEEAQQEIKRLHSQAMESVEKLNLGKIRSEMLHRYADMLLGRRK